tara:strand:- start:61 stop:1086 length:1026 start_codon:yes stop_codon:yes gene_type:complete
MILVTGGTGLVGSHLLYQICQSETKVRAIKRAQSNTSLVRQIFSYYTEKAELLFEKIEWVNADLLNIPELELAFQGVTKVYHCAAWISFNPKHKGKMMQTNIEGTANVVNLCLARRIHKLCHVSSVASLGHPRDGSSTNENTPWLNSPENSYYALSKYHSEMEVWRGIEEGLNAVIICPAIILGPGKWEKGSSMLFKQVWKGLSFYTSGTNGFVDVRDVVNVMIQLMKGKIKSERFILCSESIPFKKTLDYIAEALGKEKPHIKVGPFLSAVGWRIAKVVSIIRRKSPFITKETVLAGNSISVYNNKKIKTALNYQFKSVEQSCKDFSMLFLQEYKVNKTD